MTATLITHACVLASDEGWKTLWPTTAVLVARCSGFSPALAKVKMPVVNSFCWDISFKVKGSLGEGLSPWAPMVMAADSGLKQPEEYGHISQIIVTAFLEVGIITVNSLKKKKKAALGS